MPPVVPQTPMAPSSGLARLRRSASPLLVVGAVVLVSALCYLGLLLPSGSEHVAHSSAHGAISASESGHVAALDNETDSDGEHSCHNERAAAAHPQTPALNAVAKPVVFDSATIAATDASSPLVADRPHLSGPRQHILCVLRT